MGKAISELDNRTMEKCFMERESPFCLRFSGRSRVWQLHNERYDPLVTQPTVKHDKKVDVWGCFTSSGVGRLYKIPGIIDSKMYKQILFHQLIPSANELFKDKSCSLKIKVGSFSKIMTRNIRQTM